MCEPPLHQLKGKIDQAIDQGRWIMDVEPLQYGGKGIELLPGFLPTLPEDLTAYLLWNEIGG